MGHPGRRLSVLAVALAALLAGGLLAASPAASFLVDAGDAPGIRVRKDVKDLTNREKAAFVAAVLKAKATEDPDHPGRSRYDTFVAWHRDAFRCRNSWNQGDNWAGAAHNSPTFLPWHRQYLDEYEQMLQEVSGDPSITLPYWDWTDPASTEAVFADDFMGGDGDPDAGYTVTTGPFRKGSWRIVIKDPLVLQDGTVPQASHLVRHFGANFDTGIDLPTRADVRWSIDGHQFDHQPYNASSPLLQSFRNRMEGWREAEPAECVDGWNNVNETPGAPHVMHNAVHIYVGGLWKVGDLVAMGTMAYNTSPNDPVFFLHHANVDRIFAAWEMTGGSHYRPVRGAEQGWNATDTMWPWHDRTINSWFGTLRNGYRYASLPR